MNFFFNLFFFSALILWTILFLPVSAFLLLRYRAKRPLDEALRLVIHDYGRVCCKLLGCFMPVGAVERYGSISGPCIITPNHQSFFDPYCLSLLSRKNVVFTVRSWPFRIPVYGRYMLHAGYLNIDELDAEAFFERARACLKSDCGLAIFPEGTRSPDGSLGRFRSGAFKLAIELDLPVVPLCIDGTGRVFPKGSLFGRPGEIRVTALEPVDPAPFKALGPIGHLHLQRHVKAAMQKKLEEGARPAALPVSTAHAPTN